MLQVTIFNSDSQFFFLVTQERNYPNLLRHDTRTGSLTLAEFELRSSCLSILLFWGQTYLGEGFPSLSVIEIPPSVKRSKRSSIPSVIKNKWDNKFFRLHHQLLYQLFVVTDEISDLKRQMLYLFFLCHVCYLHIRFLRMSTRSGASTAASTSPCYLIFLFVYFAYEKVLFSKMISTLQ